MENCEADSFLHPMEEMANRRHKDSRTEHLNVLTVLSNVSFPWLQPFRSSQEFFASCIALAHKQLYAFVTISSIASFLPSTTYVKIVSILQSEATNEDTIFPLAEG